jgi:hypothetical protein
MRDEPTAPSLPKGTLPPTFTVIVRVDEETYGLRRDHRDRDLELVVHRRELTIHHDDAIVADDDGGVAAKAFKHEGAIAQIRGLDLDL